MKLPAISNVMFGQYYHDKTFNNKQLKVVEKIEDTFKNPVPFDKKGRTYERYLDAMGYDIITYSAKEEENGVKVVFLRQPINAADKVRREHCEFRYYPEDVVGIYNEEHPFDINDILTLYNKDIKFRKRNHAALLSMPFLYIAITLPLLWGISKLPEHKKANPDVVEKTIQNTTKIVKDTLKLLK